MIALAFTLFPPAPVQTNKNEHWLFHIENVLDQQETHLKKE